MLLSELREAFAFCFHSLVFTLKIIVHAVSIEPGRMLAVFFTASLFYAIKHISCEVSGDLPATYVV